MPFPFNSLIASLKRRLVLFVQEYAFKFLSKAKASAGQRPKGGSACRIKFLAAFYKSGANRLLQGGAALTISPVPSPKPRYAEHRNQPLVQEVHEESRWKKEGHAGGREHPTTSVPPLSEGSHGKEGPALRRRPLRSLTQRTNVEILTLTETT